MTMEPHRKAVLYARVSTREQADTGYSIESQTKLLKDYANNHNLEIVREFTDRWYVDAWRGFAAHKNLALSRARQPWVLSLDAENVIALKALSEQHGIPGIDLAQICLRLDDLDLLPREIAEKHPWTKRRRARSFQL